MAKEKEKNILMSNEERMKQIELTISSIQKDYGHGASQQLGTGKPLRIARMHSGSYKLNGIMGGGYPLGRIIEVYGPESSGKTTVALHAVAEFQRAGGLAVYLDAENALDLNYAQVLGVDVQNLVVGQPDTAEDCLQICEKWIRSGLATVIVVDSVAALVPKAELEGQIGDNHIGLLARLMSQALRKLAGLCMRHGTVLIFINQIREKVGVLFGNPEVTSGGRALKFYASIRLEVRPKEIVKRGEEAVARTTKIKAVKNKVAPPFREDEVDIEFGIGISKAGEILDIGTELGLIQKSGAWYAYKNERLGQGRDNTKKFLNSNPQLFEELDKRIQEMMYPDELEEQVEFTPPTNEEIEEELHELEIEENTGEE